VKDKPAELDPEANPAIIEQNRMAAKVMAEMQVPVNDFYTLLVDKRSLARGDRFHWTPPAYKLLADMCIVALTKIVRNASTTGRITRGGFVTDASSDGWAGVVYELRFTVARGVADKTFQGASATEYDAAFGPGATSLSLDGADASPGLPTATTRVSE
jgi:hypothetical protein